MAKEHVVTIGLKFGKLTVLKLQDEIRSQTLDIKKTALCICDCGIHLIVEKYNLSSGNTTQCNSCAVFTRGNKTHGHSNPLRSNTIEYKTYMAWKSMLSRCYNENQVSYDRYGARGITVCDEWKNSYENFLNDMGLLPDFNMQIDRIDNDGNYNKSNCRWATREQQANNKSNNRVITYNNESLTLQQWATKVGIKRGTIAKRLNTGCSVEVALGFKEMQKTIYTTPNGTFNSLKEAGDAHGLKTSATHSRFNSDKFPTWIKTML